MWHTKGCWVALGWVEWWDGLKRLPQHLALLAGQTHLQTVHIYWRTLVHTRSYLIDVLHGDKMGIRLETEEAPYQSPYPPPHVLHLSFRLSLFLQCPPLFLLWSVTRVCVCVRGHMCLNMCVWPWGRKWFCCDVRFSQIEFSRWRYLRVLCVCVLLREGRPATWLSVWPRIEN